MLRKLRSGLVLLPVLLICSTVQGQLPDSEREDVLRMFDQPEEVQWIRAYNGTFDAFHHARFVLGSDGTSYRGWWTPVAGQSFDLSGSVIEQEENLVHLDEIDRHGLICGTLSLTISQDRLSGTWQTIDTTRSVHISAVGSDLVEVRRFEPRFLCLKGHLDEQPFSLFLAQEAMNVQGGLATFRDEIVEVFGRCARYCDTMQLGVLGDELTGLMTLHAGPNGQYTLKFEDVEYDTKTGTARVTRSFPIKSKTWSDYHQKGEAVYPVTGYAAVDAWLDSLFMAWAVETRSGLPPGPERPGNRWSMMAAAWVDLTHWTDDLISGVITLYEPASSAYRRQSFTLETDTGISLTLDRFLRRDADLQGDLNTLVRESCPYLFEVGDNAYMHWARALRFSHLSVAETGLVASSGFDPEFGDIKALIPFEKLEKYLRVKALVRQL